MFRDQNVMSDRRIISWNYIVQKMWRVLICRETEDFLAPFLRLDAYHSKGKFLS